MKKFRLVGLKVDGSPSFSCTVSAHSLESACMELRCRGLNPHEMAMERGPMFQAAKIFATRPYVLVQYAFDGSFASAVAHAARAHVPGIDAAIVERSLRHCRRIFLGAAPAAT